MLRSIICLNGKLPSKCFFDHYQHLPIIAADGAGDKLLEIQVRPNYIMGDFDSSCEVSGKYSGIKLVKMPDQNYTDFEKLMSRLEQQQLLPAIICGIFGGEADHILNNIRCFYKYGQKHSLYFCNQENNEVMKWGKVLTAQDQEVTINFTAEPNELISLVTYSSALISIDGVKWSLQKTLLTSQGQSAIRNRAKGGLVNITIHHGAMILITTSINSIVGI